MNFIESLVPLFDNTILKIVMIIVVMISGEVIVVSSARFLLDRDKDGKLTERQQKSLTTILVISSIIIVIGYTLVQERVDEIGSKEIKEYIVRLEESNANLIRNLDYTNKQLLESKDIYQSFRIELENFKIENMKAVQVDSNKIDKLISDNEQLLRENEKLLTENKKMQNEVNEVANPETSNISGLIEKNITFENYDDIKARTIDEFSFQPVSENEKSTFVARGDVEEDYSCGYGYLDIEKGDAIRIKGKDYIVNKYAFMQANEGYLVIRIDDGEDLLIKGYFHRYGTVYDTHTPYAIYEIHIEDFKPY